MASTLETIRRDAAASARIRGRRDMKFAEARRQGATWPEIAAAAGLTELAVRNAARRANGGELPVPE